MVKTCGFCGGRFRRLDRHLAARRGCGLAAKAARDATRRVPDPNVAAGAPGSPEADADGPRDPALPGGLGAAGEALLRSVIGAFQLDQHEVMVLEAACREADVAAAADLAVVQAGPYLTDPRGNVRAHPGIATARSSRLATARLLRALSLPGKDGGR
jgi:hypothetical protein